MVERHLCPSLLSGPSKRLMNHMAPSSPSLLNPPPKSLVFSAESLWLFEQISELVFPSDFHCLLLFFCSPGAFHI